MKTDPWSHERVKKDRRPSAAHRSPARKRAPPAPSSGSRSSLWLAVGVVGGGYLLYSLFKNTASAAPAGGTPRSAAATSGNSYTVSALDASVPGVSFAPSTLQPGILTSTLTAVPAVTAQQVASANTFWDTLSPSSPPGAGYITLPSGTQFAASLMAGGNTRADGNGNLYIQWGGQVYQLANQPDSSGNWPAVLVNAG